eukprot:3963240-Prorocentrum_lima.AAC.1
MEKTSCIKIRLLRVENTVRPTLGAVYHSQHWARANDNANTGQGHTTNTGSGPHTARQANNSRNTK